MGFAKEVISLRFLVRAVLVLLMLLLLLDMIATHSSPVSRSFEIPLTIAGWLAIPLVIVLGSWHYRRYGDLDLLGVPKLNWRVIQHLVFVAIVGLILYFAAIGNVSFGCPASKTKCFKIDEWKMADGHYYRQFHYDSAGNEYLDPPWVQISRSEYVAEVGTLRREGAPLDIFPLGFAWLLSATLRRPGYD